MSLIRTKDFPPFPPFPPFPFLEADKEVELAVVSTETQSTFEPLPLDVRSRAADGTTGRDAWESFEERDVVVELELPERPARTATITNSMANTVPTRIERVDGAILQTTR